MCGSRPKSFARIGLEVDGAERRAEAEGDGPVDATFIAIQKLVPHNAKLALFQIHAVTEGTDAQAEVTVRLEENGKTVNGQAAETDTILAAARAYVTALNKLLVKREKTAPAALSA
jgi:2-isopropylmalate synthase